MPNGIFDNITATGNIVVQGSGRGNITLTGNINGANGATRMASFSRVSACGTIAGGNVVSSGFISATGAITGGNLNIATTINAVQSVRSTSLIANNTITVGNLNSPGVTVGTWGLRTSGLVSAAGTVTGTNLISVANISAGGNITGSYIFGNGAFLTGITGGGGGGGSYGNSDVAAYLPTYAGSLSGNALSVTGTVTGSGLQIGTANLAAGSLSLSNNIAIGGNITAGNITGTLRTAAQPFITSVGSLTTLSVTGQIQASSMTLAGAITANGAVTAGGQLTGASLNIADQAVIRNITFVNDSILGVNGLSATGNINGGNLSLSGALTTGGNISVGNFQTTGLISATGNITGNTIIGNGYGLTNILRSNQTRQVWVSNIAPTSGQGSVGDIWYQIT